MLKYYYREAARGSSELSHRSDAAGEPTGAAEGVR
jgi:hypothetical protein